MNTTRRTLFGFESGGVKQWRDGAGWPKVEAGDCVTLLFPDKGNWQTVAGWANHTARQIAYESPGYWLMILIFSVFANVLAYGMAGHKHLVVALIMTAFGIMACIALVRCHQCLSVKRQLNALLTSNSPETPSGARE